MKVAFYKATRPGWQGLYSRLARLVDRGPYSHAELIFSDGMSASASYIDGGVRFKKIDYDPAHWDFVDVAGDEGAAMAWFIEHNGASYDLIGNLSFLCPLIPHSRRKWFCSEAIAAALGIPDPWRQGPNGLAAVLRWPHLRLPKGCQSCKRNPV